MKRYYLVICLLLMGYMSLAQWGLTQEQRDSLYALTKADHENMKQQLGITVANRPGPSGNPNDENAANTDESRVEEYSLPDPLTFESGESVETKADWQSRRIELLELFDKEMYGEVPTTVPAVKWIEKSATDTVTGKYPVTIHRLMGVVDNSTYPEIEVEIDVELTLPQNATKATPVVIHFGFIGNFSFGGQTQEPTSFLFSRHEPDWKSQLISKGWGYATISPSSIQADNGAGLRTGIIGLTNKGDYRKPEQWGSLRAWAWGVSRLIDHLETIEMVDQKRLAIEGLSRYGKAALVTMAYEPRISLGFIGSSGAGGVKILRRNFGEQVENLAGTGEYHWFCGNFLKYGSSLNVHDLPVDAHQLVALCAPRPVFISAGSPFEEGSWVDAKGMFLAAAHAGQVYQLLGKKGLGTMVFPPLGFPIVEGDIAWRQHAGGHSTGPNWSTWIGWASRYWDR